MSVPAALVLSGCAAPPGPADPVEDSPLARNMVAFDRSQRTDSRTAIIGLYGETISRSTTTSGFGDGAANISQVTFARDGADFDPDLDSKAGRIVFASTQHRTTADIYLKSINGSAITQLTSDPADDLMPEFSPDGQSVAFTSNRAGNWDIYIMPSTGGQARLITSDPAHEIHPTWSPDGRHLAYCKFGEQSQRWELWVVDAANTALRRFIDYGFLPEWSPDPALNKILFQRARERGSRYHSVWTIDYVNGEGRNPTEIISASNAAIINPSWSPDGEHIVFVTVLHPSEQTAEVPTHSDLWIVRRDGTGRTNLTNGAEANFQPAWGADGRIYFVSNRSGAENLWSVAADTSAWERGGGGTIANVPESNRSSGVD